MRPYQDKQITSDIQEIIRKVGGKDSDSGLIKNAFEFAAEAYKERNRFSGENYIFHALRVAMALSKMDLDPTTIAFGILHDVLDDVPDFAKEVEIKDIEKKFGKEMAKLVKKNSSLGKIRYSLSVGTKEKKKFTAEKIENLRRMFLALSGDLRVILVELVSRLDGLNSLQYFPQNQQKIIALETLQIFVPIASRLGLSKIRRGLEDRAFSYLFPERFNWLKKNLKEQYEEREKYLKKFIVHLKKILKKERVGFLDINYRAKSYWSTYKKLIRHRMDFDKIHDLLALRIITSNVESCYRILGIIHKHFRPISGEINDYIAKPKPNGYRSLHTTVFSGNDKITEIQIRTEQMQKEAEYGICAHWSYKEGVNLKEEQAAKNFEWLKNAPDFWQGFKINFFTDKVFSFTPKGDVVVLPKNSTPVDFAYAVHSDIGNHCESAKINGKIVPLNSVIKNGDIIEVSVNKKKKPSKDWLMFVKTSLAKSRIRKLTDENQQGFKFPLPGFIRRKLSEISEASKKKREEKELMKKGAVRHIYIAGQKGMLIHLARCCNPQPGDKVRAYVARGRATVLHRISCGNLKEIEEKFPEKVIGASWE